MFQIIRSNQFKYIFKKLIKNNILLDKKIIFIIYLISINPKDKGLKSHKINSFKGKTAWSSRVNGDLRIIWNYGKENTTEIHLLKIGGHSGKDKVYK